MSRRPFIACFSLPGSESHIDSISAFNRGDANQIAQNLLAEHYQPHVRHAVRVQIKEDPICCA